MANNAADFKSISGQDETAEPGAAPTPTPGNANTAAARRSPSAVRSQSSSTTPIPQLRKQPSNSLLPLKSPSAGASPLSSRNNSPGRKDSRPSLQPSVPSAAAIQRALSAASVPQLQGSVSEAVSKLPRAQRTGGGSGDSTPQWPMSPRLKSPPPSASSRRGSAIQSKKPEPAPVPSINVQITTPSTATPPQLAVSIPNNETSKSEPQLQAPPKAQSRGPSGKSTLETVQENGAPTTEAAPKATSSKTGTPKAGNKSDDDRPATIHESSNEKSNEKHTKVGESGSESGGNKSDRRGRRKSQSQGTVNPQRTKTVPAKNAYMPLASAKSRQPEGTRNMTVETETVSSIPQSALNAGPRDDRSVTGRTDPSGSIRLKPSNETIRPKKERKKPARKAASINQGTASSKADIFEQRVANAVDEANSSDSDETFVYESNPPESHHRPRHHSRTPSVTSSHSQAEHARGGIRNFGNMLDNHKVAGKRSMKFSSNPYNDGDSPTSQQDGTVRSHHPRHIGRFGRGGNHTSVFDQDSPFTQASKLRNPALNGVRQGSRPSSPRSPQSQHIRPSGGLFSRSKEPSFDFDGEGADDERTPLVGSRTPRSNRNSRRVNSGSVRSTEDYYNMHQQRSRWRRCGGCLVGLVVFIAVILSAVAFLIISNKPMYGFNIKRIENVLASEQEIMLDLLVGAINPNALGITITDMDVNVFAKSKHVGTGEFWREHGHAPPLEVSPVNRRVQRVRQPPQPPAAEFNEDSWLDLSGHWKPTSSIDEGTDPIDDDAGDPQTMLLGRIFHFDQALTFEGSPLKRHIHYSVGELRLMKPGNKTEIGGSERWEKVLQYPFELIIRGVLKYQLPISSRAQTAAIGASVLVHPEDGVDRAGNMRLEKVDHSEEWQWVEWNDLKDDEEEIRVVEVVG